MKKKIKKKDIWFAYILQCLDNMNFSFFVYIHYLLDEVK